MSEILDQPISEVQQVALGAHLPEHIQDFQILLSETERLFTTLSKYYETPASRREIQETQEYLLASIIRLRGACCAHITALISTLSNAHLRDCRDG